MPLRVPKGKRALAVIIDEDVYNELVKRVPRGSRSKYVNEALKEFLTYAKEALSKYS